MVTILVAPLAGAWIEIYVLGHGSGLYKSPPSRGRGLKFFFWRLSRSTRLVAPLAGAWIEIRTILSSFFPEV